MRRRRTNEGYGDTAASLGGAVDELMRHQPTLRAQAMQDVVKVSLPEVEIFAVDFQDEPFPLFLVTTRAVLDWTGSQVCLPGQWFQPTDCTKRST